MTIDPLPESGRGSDIRPIVGRGRRDIPTWLLIMAAVIGAMLLFLVLDGQRREAAAPATAVRPVDGVAATTGLPPLFIPPDLLVPPPPPPPFIISSAPAVPVEQPRQMGSLPIPPGPAVIASASPSFSPPPVPSSVEPASTSRGDVLIFDGTASARSGGSADLRAVTAGGAASQSAEEPMAAGGRARSSRLGQLSTTVPQGTLIPAVLETALDSTRPGHVRALVSRDVRGFDGLRVLIPRGSRLFGEYSADLSPGQNRAFVTWTRLVRPDGVSIDLDSPAADALGRAGVQGRVNNHFLERFSSALLQSTLSVGVALASSNLGDNPVIVALPGSMQTLTTSGPAQQVQPTLVVDAGASVTVLVARDLTFPGVEGQR
jgi:type IV secretion system protein VirB10